MPPEPAVGCRKGFVYPVKRNPALLIALLVTDDGKDFVPSGKLTACKTSILLVPGDCRRRQEEISPSLVISHTTGGPPNRDGRLREPETAR